MFDLSKVGIILIIVILAFFIHIFYYLAWGLTDHWISLSDEKLSVV